MNVGEKLAELREELTLSQKELADILHIGHSTISGYERGASLPSYPVLVQFADYFGVNIDYLLGRTEIKMSWAKIEGNLTTGIGLVPIDSILKLNSADKEIIGRMVLSLLCKDEYQKK